MPGKKRSKGRSKKLPLEAASLDLEHLKERARLFRERTDGLKTGSLDDLIHVLDATGNVAGTVHASIKQSRKEHLEKVIVIMDSSGNRVGQVAQSLLISTEDLRGRSLKGSMVVMDETGKVVGAITEETLNGSGMVLAKTKDGAVVIKKQAEHVSGADEARTRKEYYQRLGYFFIPLWALVLLFASYFVFMPFDDALKMFLGQLGYLFAIPGFDPNTLILGANSFGLNPFLMAFLVGVQDTIVGIFLCLNFDYVKRIPIIGKLIGDLEEDGSKMLKKYKWLDRLSLVGLFIFILLPFSGFGPVGGAIVGRMIGIRKSYIIISIIVGSFVSVFALAFLADLIADIFPKWVQIGIPIVLAVLLVSGFVLSQVKKRKAKKKQLDG